MTLVVGVDIGGTKTAAGLVDPTGNLLAVRSRPTPATRGPDAVVDAAAELVRELDGGAGTVTAVGVGSAGVIDPRSGTVVSATGAIPGWAGTDLRGELSRRLGLPVAVDNDVHAHALGELWRGAAAGRDDVLLVAVGTGVGASLVLGGRVRHGAHSVAGHAGHLPVPAAAGRPCPCGGHGHVEAVASGPALLAEYRRRSGAEAGHLSEVVRLADAGDPIAAAVLAEGAGALGAAIGGLVNVIDPELVLVGGGVTGCGEPWWRALREAVRAEALPALRDVPIEPAALGGDAALLGAARLALAAASATTTPAPTTTASTTTTPAPTAAASAPAVPTAAASAPAAPAATVSATTEEDV
ncbi:ROK family protein [Streptosporangium pseudovulgare]|uniref:Transcriptional regulator n=1 Tax=Streptosporangium pseudovulgare TaxID=35765 RepID=A0ABQ2R4Z7_9ACTN|nr:ROK family protein [Streptosporangium pseudovulgare]GGQ11606.1 transcriptional regulator [Streptosporangium pseudovulgare]